MAVQIIDEPTLGGNLGRAVGTGISGLLENLVQRKATELEQNKRAMGYEQNWGLDKEQAKMLASQPADFQQEILKALVTSQQNNAISRELHPDQQMMHNLGTMLQSQPGMQSQPQSLEGLMNSMQGQQQGPQDAITMALQKGLPQLLRQEQLGKVAQLPQRQEIPESVRALAAQKPQQPQKVGRSIADILQNKDLNPDQRLRVEALKQQRELAERKMTAAEQRDINKETKEIYHETNKAAKSARDSDIRLGRMEELVNKGNLSNTAFYNGMKAMSSLPGVGGFFESIAQSFLNPDTQEFEKLSTDFIKDAKQFFGNRVTEQEIGMFLKTVPTLSQTNPGKKRVIRNMRIFNEAARVRQNAMKDVIKANGGKRPEDLETLIEEVASSRLDALASEFRGSAA